MNADRHDFQIFWDDLVEDRKIDEFVNDFNCTVDDKIKILLKIRSCSMKSWFDCKRLLMKEKILKEMEHDRYYNKIIKNAEGQIIGE